jgi:hypothetical protein
MVSSDLMLGACNMPFYMARMTEAEAANELMRLAKQIAYHNARYHTDQCLHQ